MRRLLLSFFLFPILLFSDGRYLEEIDLEKEIWEIKTFLREIENDTRYLCDLVDDINNAVKNYENNNYIEPFIRKEHFQSSKEDS